MKRTLSIPMLFSAAALTMVTIPAFCKTPLDVGVTVRLYDYVKLPASARSEVVAPRNGSSARLV